jgi:creatine kinase
LEHAHKTDLDPAHLDGQAFSPEAMSRIVSTRMRVARNLSAPFVMNPNGTAESRIAVLDMIENVTAGLDEELRGTIYRHATMTPAEEQELIDGHFLFKGRDARQAACGYHQFWPAGRGIFQSRDKLFNIWINEGDHLRIMALIPGGDIVAVVTKLSKAVQAISAGVAATTGAATPFAQHPILGMITCCPTNLGTGCRASVHIDLPRLVEKIGLDGIDKICEENGCQARGSTGEFSEVTQSAKVDISNRYRLGYSEIDLVKQMIVTVNKLAAMEVAEESGAGAV